MNNAKSLMVQGTASSVGKSIITAGLCRIFFQDGIQVAPFKSQNMALNSFVTKDGFEMGRAQVVQAEAAGILPACQMNPILIKPTADMEAQLIVNGRVSGNMNAMNYHLRKKELKSVVAAAYNELSSKYKLIVLEGAGSPAEINLRENDLVNMGMAEISDSPVVLVADIDKGGAFAAVVGTLQLLAENEKARVKGIIINKFRGDIELLKPGLKMLEDIIHIPVLGVVPYFNIMIEDEDSVSERFYNRNKNGEIKIYIIKTPYLSNCSDFDVFQVFDDVSIYFASRADEIIEPDMIIIPGSKNTIEDMYYIRKSAIEEKIKNFREKGVMIFGICAGYQMLGNRIEDPENIESSMGAVDGMGFIPMNTVIKNIKKTSQVSAEIIPGSAIFNELQNKTLNGYEIHMGSSAYAGGIEYSFYNAEDGDGGYFKENIFGSYIHGIFDNTEFTAAIIDFIREKKGLEKYKRDIVNYVNFKENEFNRLAKILRENLDIDKIYKIINHDADI